MDVKILNDLKAEGTGHKFVQFPSKETFNKLLDLMQASGVTETADMLDEFVSGGVDTEDLNKGIKAIVDSLNAAIKAAKSDEAKKYLENEKARQEKKLNGGKRVSLPFVLKFLLKTNAYEEIQALADEI